MKNKILTIFYLIALSASMVFAQTNGMPVFIEGQTYASVRKKMLKSGWKPFRAPDADKCGSGDARCKGKPEMQSCAGTGMANCKFLWKRKGKTVAIFTVGEDAEYQSYEFEN